MNKILFGLVVLVVVSYGFKLEAPCVDKTKVCVYHAKDAVGEPVWECETAVNGQYNMVAPAVEEVKICGYGKFTFSPMSCAGNHFQHAAESWTLKTKSDGGCQVMPLKHFASCYKVEC